MKRRFVVLVEPYHRTGSATFLNWIKENQLGWWHWVSNAWLLTSRSNTLTATEIRDKVKTTNGGRVLVIEVTGNLRDWAGFGPKSKTNDMFKWLHDNWGND